MRQIVIDTETTGLETAQGHRIVELAAVEITNRRRTDSPFHRYLNPERESDAAALEVHGLTATFLQDKPKFADIVPEFLDYVRGAELILHNAAFDIAFLNREMELLNLGPIADYCSGVVDTLTLARERHPGKKNTLDALCERYQVNRSRRTLHSALVDAELLADVYLSMTRGQESLEIEIVETPQPAFGTRGGGGRRVFVVMRATEQELRYHADQLAKIDKAAQGNCLWMRL